jgi:hypothetical protein
MRTSFIGACVSLASLTAAPAAFAQTMPSEYQQLLSSLGKQGDYKANVLKVSTFRAAT